MIPKHIAKLRSLKAAYKIFEDIGRGLGVTISEHLGCDVSLVFQQGDGVCINLSSGVGGITQLTEDTLTKILSLPRKDAIQYIRDRSI
jgi:hypothetical protein